MKRLGENSITAGRARWFAAALLLVYVYLFLLHINTNLWFKLLIVYFPCIVLLFLFVFLARYRGEKIELKIILLFAAWVIFTRILHWDIKDYFERCRTGGITYPDDALLIASSMMAYVPMAACLVLPGRTRERFLDAIAIVTASFSTVTTTFSLYAVLNKMSIPAPFGGTYLCIIDDPRLYVFGKNPNTCCMWYFLGIFFLAYLFFRTKNRLCRALMVAAAFLNYVVLAMTFSRNGMFSFSLCTGLLVLVLVLRRFSPKTVGRKVLCTVLVLALIVPLAYTSFSLVDRGMEKASSAVIQKRKDRLAAQEEESGGAEMSGYNTAAFAPAGLRMEMSDPLHRQTPGSPRILQTEDDDNREKVNYVYDRGFGDSGRLPIYKTFIPTMQRDPKRLLIGCLDKDAMKYTDEILGKDIINFHNTFLQILCETGVIGLGLALAFLVLVGRRVIRIIYSDAPVTVSILALMLAGIVTYNILEVDLFLTSDAACFAAYTAAGAVLAYFYEHCEKQPGKREKRTGRQENKTPAAG